MDNKVSIIIEKNEHGYLVSFPELESQQLQDKSLDVVLKQLKETLNLQLKPTQIAESPTTGQSILNLVQKFTADMTDDEISQLPTDGAEQHDHYLYGTPKRNP
jgi:predicted RNase H-like HicB family nuclease